MKIKKFSELTEKELNYIIDVHYSHWVNFNPKMIKDNTTIYKFTKLYTTDELPFGIALIDDKDNNVDKRLSEHLTNKGAKYTKSHQAEKLESVWRSKDKSFGIGA